MAITTPSTADLASARARNEDVWKRQTALLFSKRIAESFAYWHEDARYESVYPVDGMPAVVQGRDALAQMFSAMLAAGERVASHDFRFHQTDDEDVVFIEERFVMDLVGGGRFENRVIMRVTFREGLIAEMLEYADRRAVENLIRRLQASA